MILNEMRTTNSPELRIIIYKAVKLSTFRYASVTQLGSSHFVPSTLIYHAQQD